MQQALEHLNNELNNLNIQIGVIYHQSKKTESEKAVFELKCAIQKVQSNFVKEIEKLYYNQ